MAPITASNYRYANFRLQHMLADLRFDPESPGPGDRLVHLDLETVDGEHIGLGELDRPHLFVFGSMTCPMTASAGAPLGRLHRRFGDAIRIVLVNVREAHPGELLPQPSTVEDKLANARRLQRSVDADITIAVDDLDGTFHTSLDPKPNAAYLVAADGTILFRSLWASDEDGLAAAMASVTRGDIPRRTESRRMMAPMVGSIGYVDGVLRNAGRDAVRDVARGVPPMLIGARLASLFRWLPPARRGLALLGTAGVLVAVVLVIAAIR